MTLSVRLCHISTDFVRLTIGQVGNSVIVDFRQQRLPDVGIVSLHGEGLPEKWNPYSWLGRPAAQQVEYRDDQALELTCQYLRKLPPLVSSQDIEQARWELYQVAKEKAFIIQGGDCAESFHDVQPDIIKSKYDLLTKQSEILSVAFGKPVIRIGRMAGQYAKPRSNPFETLPNGETIHAFRGHNVNSEMLDCREPDPQRLIMGYLYAATTLNTINMIESGHYDSVKAGTQPGHGIYTSHEALHLPFESALTKGRYNHSAAFLWIGERTRQLNGAHVEYARGLRNPISIKVGPTTTPETLVSLLDALSPSRNQYGKVSIITRLGRGQAPRVLPSLIRAVQLSHHNPVWICDPCHGNTLTTKEGLKTRRLDFILEELLETYVAHRTLNNYLGGIHLEQTGEDVTECLDDISVTRAEDLAVCYQSLCDPRLSRLQALSLVEQFAAFVVNYERNKC